MISKVKAKQSFKKRTRVRSGWGRVWSPSHGKIGFRSLAVSRAYDPGETANRTPGRQRALLKHTLQWRLRHGVQNPVFIDAKTRLAGCGATHFFSGVFAEKFISEVRIRRYGLLELRFAPIAGWVQGPFLAARNRQDRRKGTMSGRYGWMLQAVRGFEAETTE